MQGNIYWHYYALNFSKVIIYLVLTLSSLLSHQSAIAQPNVSKVVSSDYWTIELVSFTNRPAAEVFIERLAKKHFQTEIITVEAGGDTSYRTRTPPFPSLAAAKDYRNLLRIKTNLHDSHLVIQGPLQAADAGWYIDLIRYESRGDAEAFVNRLRNKGFDAVIIALDISGRSMYQTRTSQFMEAVAVSDYRDRLKQDTNILDNHLQIYSPSALRLAETSSKHVEVVEALAKEVSTAAASGQQNDATVRPANVVKDRELTVESSRSNKPAPGSEAVLSMASGVGSDMASWFPDWHVYGSNTLRSDVYNSKGNLAATPYRFSNTHTYDELNLNVDRIFSPFHRITGQISGLLYNDSQYRSQSPGFVLERVNLRQENGEFIMPYRAEAGDFFAFQSYRTIQRSLKGGRIEFQPQWSGADLRHSIELFSGTASASWDNFQYKDDFSSGASWLVQHPLAGTLAANFVVNHKQANGFAQPSLQQYVSSLAWEKRAMLLGQQLVIEAEADRFIGDHPAVVPGLSGKQRQGNGFFGQVSGVFDALPQLSYRIRGEAYDQDYVPNGASIQSDRNSQEGYLTWRDPSGLAFTARMQHYHTAWQTSNPTDTITYGGNISGMIPILGVSGSIDAFSSDVEDRNLTANTIAKVVNINLSKSLSPDLSLRIGYYYANNHDKNNALSGLLITQQYSAGADMRINWQGITGTLSPGMVARRFDQQGIKRWDYNPTFNANFNYNDHQLSMNLSKLDQSSQVLNNGVDTMTAGLNYRYTQPKYTLGLDANWYDRQPDNSGTLWTNSWRLGAYFTYNFDRPVQRLAMARQETVSDVSPTPSIERMLFDISRLTPGMDERQAKILVAEAGLGEASDQAGFLVWYAQIFRDISENQRLALETRGDRIMRSAVIIDVGVQNDVAGIRTLFERMRRQLLAAYGQPDAFFDQGDFTPNMTAELAAGRFIRVMEWKRKDGILRFGIPRRLDGRIRMELQFGRFASGLKDTLWSMEEVQ
jgi:hypothetical protein